MNRILVLIAALAISGCQVDQSSTEKLAASMTVSTDQFSGATTIRGPKVGSSIIGTDHLAAMTKAGRVQYAAFSEITATGWVFPKHAYVAGDQSPRRIFREDSQVNCTSGCITTEVISIPLTATDIARGKVSGIAISVRGTRGNRLIEFSPQYVQAFSDRVSP